MTIRELLFLLSEHNVSSETNLSKITKHTPYRAYRVVTLPHFRKKATFYAPKYRVSFKMSNKVDSFKKHTLCKTNNHSLDGYV